MQRPRPSCFAQLLPGFTDGRLRPFPVHDNASYPLERAVVAYRAVNAIDRDRIVLLPNK